MIERKASADEPDQKRRTVLHRVAPRLVVWLSARIVPRSDRAQWLEMWLAELDALGAESPDAAHGPLAFALGAPKHALIEAFDGWTMFGVWRDLHYAVRRIAARPAFAAAIVATLALGIGANALVFGVVRAVLLKPLPYPDPEQLVTVWQTQPGNDTRRVGPANFFDWRAASSFEGLAAYDWRQRSLGGGEPERIAVATVSSNFFRLLRLDASVGRTFGAPVGEGGMREIVLREDLWRRRFNADARILGQTIRLDEETLTVVGVVPTRTAFPEDVAAWTQARHDVPEIGGLAVPVDIRRLRDVWYFRVLGRLRSGVTLAQAQGEMDVIARRLRELYPDDNADAGINVVDLRAQLTGASARILWILAGVVACVLAIACTNVAMLLLAHAVGRQRELAIRTALGASRMRMVRQLSVESLLLALMGAAAGLVLAWAAQPALLSLLPETMPRTASIVIDRAVVAFALALSVVTALAFGIGPAIIASRTGGLDGMRDGGRAGASPPSARASSTLVATQLALSLVLITGTGLMLRTVWTLYQRETGMDVERLLTADVTLPDARSRGRAAAVLDFDRILQRLGTLPGVTGAAAIQSLPLASPGPSANIRVDGRVFPRNEAPDVAWRVVTPDYFRTVGTPVLRGRAFTDADGSNAAPVAIINARMASLLWPTGDPIGVRIGTGLDGDGAPVTIVGVVADTPQEGLSAPVRPAMYRPLAQPSRFQVGAMSLVIRTDNDPSHLARAVREAVREVHPQAPVTSIRPMSVVAASGLATELTAARALAIFGGLALVLAAVGLHGVMSRLVGDRTRELGVRIALGAAPQTLLWLVLQRTLKLALAGIVAGTAGAVLLSQPLRALLHDGTTADPVVFAMATAVLLLVALVASYVPARRAARIDPLVAIRTE